MSTTAQPIDYEQLKIKSYTHWDLYLHENQCYLGRTFAMYKGAEYAIRDAIKAEL
jgi:hypothetical protein